MLEIQRKPKLTDIANFIAQLNSNPKHHIGFCGKEMDEILNSLEEDFTDMLAREAFLSVTENNEIVGVCGFDTDLERGNVEI